MGKWNGLVFAGKSKPESPMIFMGKSDWFSGENFPNKTNPIKNGMEKIEKVDESGKKIG